MKKVELKPITEKERLTPEALFQPGWEEAFKPEEIPAVREYLNHYVNPHYDKTNPENIKRHCCNCGMEMDSFKQMLGLAAAYEWGMVHGEAYCSNCGYPARALHQPKMEGQEEPIFTLNHLYLEYFDVEIKTCQGCTF